MHLHEFFPNFGSFAIGCKRLSGGYYSVSLSKNPEKILVISDYIFVIVRGVDIEEMSVGGRNAEDFALVLE